jgi:hypothetical protein
MISQASLPDSMGGSRWTVDDVLMLVYLVTGAWLLPLIIGETLVALGLLQAMNEQTMPSWMYGYTVITMFLVALGAFVAWIPALLICVIYRKQWRGFLPALAVIAFAAGLIPLNDHQFGSTLMNVGGIGYPVLAFGIGLEWLLRRRPTS